MGLALVLLAFISLSLDAKSESIFLGPLRPEERQTVEPSRAVAAPDFRDAYCAKWTDGCETCQRTFSQQEPSCSREDSGTAKCERREIRCEATLPAIDRVCLSYTDGCNRCTAHGCTAMACRPRLEDQAVIAKGLLRPTTAATNYRCIIPRALSYSDPKLIKVDLRGDWLLRNPQGLSCEIIIDFKIELSSDCMALDRPVTAITQLNVQGPLISLSNDDGQPLLTFDDTNLDALSGVSDAKGYELDRVDVEPVDFRSWEGSWELSTTDNGAGCQIFLATRLKQVGQVTFIVPQEVNFSSHCISQDDGNKLQFSILSSSEEKVQDNRRTIFVTSEPVLLPKWVSWSYRGHELVFRDIAGGMTVFDYDSGRSWVATIQRPGRSPFQLHIKHIPPR